MSHPETQLRKMLAAKDAHAIEEFVACVAPDATMWSPSDKAEGRDGFRAWLQREAGGFPTAKTDVTCVINGDDMVAFEAVVTTTNTGPLETPMGTLPATGRTVTLPYAGVIVFEAGLAKQMRIYFDAMDFMAQLGLLPQPQSV